MTERNEHSIWVSRWLGKRVSTPDGEGVCSGFSEVPAGVVYQVRFLGGPGGPDQIRYSNYPNKDVKLIGKT